VQERESVSLSQTIPEATPARATKQRGAPTDGAICAALFGFALLVRLITWPTVVLGDRILLFGFDAYYHMRRITYALAHFPAQLDFDPYIGYPEGARAIWTPVFDATLSVLLWPLRDAPPRSLELAASLLPPLFGALTVVVLYRIAARHFDRPTALMSALALAVMPGHFWYSQLGFVDHHCMIALVTTGLLGTAMSYQRAYADNVLGLRHAVGLGLLVGVCLITWPGTLLQVGLVQFALLTTLLMTDAPRQRAIGTRLLAAVHGVAFCVVAPFALGNQWGQWSATSPVVLSNFQPWYLSAAAAFALASGRVWQAVPAFGARFAGRTLSAFGCGVVVLGISALFLPSLLEGASEAFGWLAKSDDFQALVSESTPLFDVAGRFSLVPAVANLSGFVLLAPFAAVWLLVRTRSADTTSGGAANTAVLHLALGWALTLCLFAMQQRRFVNVASVGVALLLGITLRALFLHFFSHAEARRKIGVAAASVAFALVLSPALIIYAPILSRAGAGDDAVQESSEASNALAIMQTASWLRDYSEPTRGWLDASVQPEYGVLAPWPMGHAIEYVARRPAITNNFGDDIGARTFLLGQRYFQAEADEANAILARLSARFVILTRRHRFLPEPPSPNSIYWALFKWDGAEYRAREGARSAWRPGVGTHRLVYEHAQVGRDSSQPPITKVFEIVRGADVRGRATPGTVVRMRIDLITEGQRLTEWSSRSVADARGHWQIRVPYANTPSRAAVHPGEAYKLECGRDVNGVFRPREHTEISVSEWEVQRGETVTAPTACGRRAGRGPSAPLS
jgi:asparagine N-glycosylation enzyme membrane subunit Stt3